MQIALNDESIECADRITVAALLAARGLHAPGIALALNQQILPREQWDRHALQDGDSLLLFQVIAGG